MSKLTEITKALAELDEEATLKLVGEALSEQVPAGDILQACQEGMNQVGGRFECQEYFGSYRLPGSSPSFSLFCSPGTSLSVPWARRG